MMWKPPHVRPEPSKLRSFPLLFVLIPPKQGQRPSNKNESIEVTVTDVSFRSDDGRFTVARVARNSRPNEAPFVAVGTLGDVALGETLRIIGRFNQHKKYGARFRVQSFVPIMPSTKEGIRRYLGSGMIPGIGKGLAKRLVTAFGADTLDIIATQSARLREVSGIGKQRAVAIADAVRARRDEAELMSFLHALGLGPTTARRLLERYGDDAARQLRDDPYLVAEQVRGIGFRTADEIGAALGIATDDPRRAAGAALHVLGRAADQGNVLLPRDALCERTSALRVPSGPAADAIEALAEQGLVALDGRDAQDVYAPPLHAAEKRVARQLRTLARARTSADGATAQVERALTGRLSEQQRQAALLSTTSGLMVLTGGPGTGKTTTVAAIVKAQLALERRILLCAPTGRAAKRLTEATGAEAKTIHRLLEWNPATGTFKRDAQNPLEVDVVLVDEASMLNLQLASSLCNAVAPSSRLILVGDVDQLPPIGAGQVLREVIRSETADVVRLGEVFRQAQRSAIVRGAHSVLRGDMPVPSERRPPSPPSDTEQQTRSGELFVIRATAPDLLHQRLIEVMNRIAKRYGFDPLRDVQVLSPMRKGPFGIETLNTLLQQSLNANADPKMPGAFAVGDKVMQLKNNYDKEVFNGDLGIIRRIQGGITYVTIDGREIQYGRDELDMLSLAYASTVHKVQGSEFPAVVIVLHGSHHMLLSRALLYTALTRAKELVVLIGDPRAMLKAARNGLSSETYCRLAERLRSNTANTAS